MENASTKKMGNMNALFPKNINLNTFETLRLIIGTGNKEERNYQFKKNYQLISSSSKTSLLTGMKEKIHILVMVRS